MDKKNIESYLPKDQDHKLLKQIQEAVSKNNEENSEEEIRAAIGLMFLHYKSVARMEKVKQDDLNRRLMIANENLSNNEPNMHPNARGNCSKTFLLDSCRSILREFLSQNGY